MINVLSRRQLLGRAACGFGALALAGLAGSPLPAVDAPRTVLHHPAKAKRVIFLFMAGGVSQVDSFDWKPELVKQDGRMLDFADERAIKRGGTGAKRLAGGANTQPVATMATKAKASVSIHAFKRPALQGRGEQRRRRRRWWWQPGPTR